MIKHKAGSVLLWITGIAYTCAMALCLLMMIASSVAISFAGLSRIVGLVIAGVGLFGCIALLLLGGAAIVAAVTVLVMRKTEKHVAAAVDGDAAPADSAAK
jgi:hypothetical protein